MEGIETADAILSQVYPKAHFEIKDQAKEARARIDIKKLKMDRLEQVFVPASPISLMINHTEKL
ncbi:hypothetical protein D3C87_11200 [compost metagenome]